MSSVLIVEDDLELARVLTEVLLEAGHTVVCSETGLVAQRRQLEMPFDVAIVDLMLPPSFGTEGIDFVRWLRAEYPATACFMMTQMERGTTEIVSTAHQLGVRAFFDKHAAFLTDKVILAVESVKASGALARSDPSRMVKTAGPRAPLNSGADFLLIAPLEEERDALLSMLDGPRKVDADGRDPLVYFQATVATRRADGAVYRVVVTSPVSMGPTDAAIATLTAVLRWRPRFAMVVGIAGGVSGEVGLGDVVVARSVADYSIGKIRESGVREERWEQMPADATLLNAASAFGSGWEASIQEKRPIMKGRPVRHVGVIACGGDVIASKELISVYRMDMPKLVAVEMEGAGVAKALHQSQLRPGFLMIRGISDLADARGNASTKRRWRAYARESAAAYAVALLREGPVPGSMRS